MAVCHVAMSEAQSVWLVGQERAQRAEEIAESSRQHIAELDGQLAQLQVSTTLKYCVTYGATGGALSCQHANTRIVPSHG